MPDSKKKFYISTPIYYPSASPHLGHAYCTTMCDVIARGKRLRGYDVFFVTGLDEHGQKIEKNAEAKGVTPQAFVDEVAKTFTSLWNAMEISNDDFIRTTEERHVSTVQKIFSRMLKQDDIYLSSYTGWYCVHEETFWTETQVEVEEGEHLCPECHRPVEKASEDAYFYRCTKYSQGNVLKRIAFTGSYTYSKSAKTEIEPRLVEAKNDILKNVYPAASDYDKIKYIYETIIKNTEYNLNSPDNQNVISVLLNHSSVCQGYAKTFQWLLNDLGIPCTLDNGVVIGGERHAWNVCMADGEWYYVDPTWGDSSYTNPDGSNVSFLPEINYDYLLVPLSELSHTHTSEAVVAMPLATSIADNYYVREGLYLTGYDFNAVKAMADGQRALGRQALVVKCADDAVFQAAAHDLVDNQKIFDLVNTKEIRYQLEDDNRKLVFALQ